MLIKPIPIALDEFVIEIDEITLREFHSKREMKYYIYGRIKMKIHETLTRPWIEVLATDTE